MTKEKYIKRIRDLYNLLRTSSSSRVDVRIQVLWYAAGIRECMIQTPSISVEDFNEICTVDVGAVMDEMEASYGI